MTPKTLSPPLRRFLPLISILILIPLLGCNLLNRVAGDDPAEPQAESDLSLEQALEIEPDDSRPTVLEEMGPPDAFKITFQEIEGQTVRWESWSYFDLTSQFDFIDGELLWAVDLEPVEDGSFFAHWYDPLDFQAGMSPAEVTALFPEVEFGEIDLSVLEVESTLALAGEQILFGFMDDQLVYVETFILSPDPESPPLNPPEAETTADQEPTPEATQDDQEQEQDQEMVAFLRDDFDTVDPYPIPIATDDFMTLENSSGRGELTTHYEQSLMAAIYQDFSLDDFILEVDIEFKDPRTGTKAGVIFRAEDPADGMDHYYLVMIAPMEEGLVLATFKQTEWLRWDLVDIPPELLSADHSYQLSLDCRGDLTSIFIDDVEVTRLEDAANPAPGLFGIVVAAYEVPETAFFDNLLILEQP